VAARLNLAHNGDAKATQQKGDVDIYSVSTVLNELLKHARCPSALSAQRLMRPSGCFYFSLRISSRQFKDHDQNHFLQIIALGGAVYDDLHHSSLEQPIPSTLVKKWLEIPDDDPILRIRMWIHVRKIRSSAMRMQ
jgi:hypothetical protein